MMYIMYLLVGMYISMFPINTGIRKERTLLNSYLLHVLVALHNNWHCLVYVLYEFRVHGGGWQHATLAICIHKGKSKRNEVKKHEGCKMLKFTANISPTLPKGC